MTMKCLLYTPLIILSGCASGTARPELLSSGTPPRGQRCTIGAVPDPLPSVAEVVDTARFSAALRGEFGSIRGYTLVSLRADSTGEWTRVRSIEGDLPAPAEERAVALLAQHLRPADGVRRMRIRLDLDPLPGFELGPSESCAPAVRNEPEVVRLLRAEAQAIGARGIVVLWIRTDELGRAGEVRIHRSSGSVQLDAAAARVARRMEFHPALLDGVPVAIWAQVPLHF